MEVLDPHLNAAKAFCYSCRAKAEGMTIRSKAYKTPILGLRACKRDIQACLLLLGVSSQEGLVKTRHFQGQQGSQGRPW